MFVLVLTLVLVLNDAKGELFASAQGPQGGARLPVVTHTDQENAPLRIVSTFVETPSPDRTVVRVMVRNQDNRKIRALALTANTLVYFYNLTGRASVLQPANIKTFDLHYTGERRPEKINVAVDFVEFGDGTTWGPDMSNYKDRLAGEREGAKAERRRLRELFGAKGQGALRDRLEAGEQGDSARPEAAGRTVVWAEGYSSGVMALRHRVRQALQTGNPDNVRAELAKPYDTSEDN
ncbi:MAG TPA: hypothetical protein VEY08_11995 [Chloroflexia bacterium]|nr:hypothetical protein [Chloroflexia bacterium]